MKKRAKKSAMTMDRLATLVQQGFNELGDKMGQGFSAVQKQADERFKLIIDRFGKVEADVADVKRAIGPMVQMLAANDREIGDIKVRLNRVERKVGFK